jgi:hypothetical protein
MLTSGVDAQSPEYVSTTRLGIWKTVGVPRLPEPNSINPDEGKNHDTENIFQ